MYIYHYILESDDKLPPRAAFVDPQYGLSFSPKPEETLLAFLTRIHVTLSNHHVVATKPLPPEQRPHLFTRDLSREEFRELVIASLIETSSPQDLKIYFKKVKLPPSLAQVKSLAKTATKELFLRIRSKKRQIDPLKRASYCLECPFHSRTSGFSGTLARIANLITPECKTCGPNKYLAAKAVATAKPPKSPENKFTAIVDRYADKSLAEVKEKLGTCKMCGCDLKNKVNFQIPAILISTSPEQISKLLRTHQEQAFDKCWILKESLESTDTRALLVKKLKSIEPSGEILLDAYEAALHKDATTPTDT